MPTQPMPISLAASDGFVPVQGYMPSAGAAGVLRPGMSVGQAVDALGQAQLGPDAVQLMSQAMEPAKAMRWGIASGKSVAGKLSPADAKALKVAEELVAKAPAAQAQSEMDQVGQSASAAATEAGFAGPGAFMAQALAVAAPAGALAAGGASMPALASHAVGGAVMLSAAAQAGVLPPPADPAGLKTVEDPEAIKQLAAAPADPGEPPAAPPSEQYALLKPFIDLGKQIAGGP